MMMLCFWGVAPFFFFFYELLMRNAISLFCESRPKDTVETKSVKAIMYAKLTSCLFTKKKESSHARANLDCEAYL